MTKHKLISNNLFDLNPMDMTSTFNTYPEISVTFKNFKTNFDISRSSMLVDNKEVPLKIIGRKIFYNPPCPLNYGEHYVRVFMKDFTGTGFLKEWSFFIQNPYEVYNFYFGIPHAHTSYSDGKGTPALAYENARKNGLDFLFVTDHSNFLDGVKRKNYEYDKETNQYIEKVNSQWFKTRMDAETFNNRHNDFIALRGFEMSTSYGHINVINTNSYVEGKKQIKTMESFSKWLKAQNNMAVSINHPNHSFKRLGYIPELDKIINLIEVGNGADPKKYIRTEKFYFDALDAGWHLGAINGQDNHIDNWGIPDNLTVVLSASLNKNDFIKALKNRRTYSTETRTLQLIFKANKYIMGSIITVHPFEIINFEIYAADSDIPIDKLQLISNRGIIIAEKSCSNFRYVKWNIKIRAPLRTSWYVVKVTHFNGKWGISSPIFLKFQK